MAYRLLAGETIEQALRRIARERIGKAAGDLAGAGEDLHESVHEFRKRCKEIRGLIRLVRPVFPGYDDENVWFRDRSRELSELRDATSSRECLAGVVERFDGDLPEHAFADVDEWLEERRLAMSDEDVTLQSLARLRIELQDAGARAARWSLATDAPGILETGLCNTYRRARKGMQRAAAETTAAAFHEWRKRVKYYRHQTQLISPAWPRVMKAVHRESRRLSDILGDEHDLAVLRETLIAEAPESLRHAALLALIDRRVDELRGWALALGRRLFAEKPDACSARLRAILAAWQDEQADAALLSSSAMRRYP